jgi:hypothetical protein
MYALWRHHDYSPIFGTGDNLERGCRRRLQLVSGILIRLPQKPFDEKSAHVTSLCQSSILVNADGSGRRDASFYTTEVLYEHLHHQNSQDY